MNRFLTLFFVISFLFASCKKTFTYVETDCPEIGNNGTTFFETTIEAYGVGGAKEKAIELYNNRRKNIVETVDLLITGKTEWGDKDLQKTEFICEIPMGFTLYEGVSAYNRKAVFESHKSPWETMGIIEGLNDVYSGNNNIAYADAVFGMTLSQVANLAKFKDYNRKNNCLIGKERIGLFVFNVALFFNSYGLFQVEISSEDYKPSNINYINIVRNLRNVFWRAYGKPSYYSSILVTKDGDYSDPFPLFVYEKIFEWNMRYRIVSIEINKTTITSKEWMRIARDKEIEKEKLDRELADCFDEMIKKIKDSILTEDSGLFK